MGRTAKHNWKKLFLEYNQGRYKNVAEFARTRGLNPVAVRREFKKITLSDDALKTEQNPTKKQNKTEQKNEKKTKTKQNINPWENLKKQFLDWPEEKLRAYIVQIEERLAELNSVSYEELSPEDKKELSQLRRERRAILSDPDPAKICKAVRNRKKCNNPVERGKEVCWNHGGAPGSGGQPGSKNALKTGEYEVIWIDALDKDEQDIIDKINLDPIRQVEQSIQLYEIRERRMLKRIQDLKNGLTEKQRRVLQERKSIKDVVPVYDEKTGQTKTVVLPRDELVITEIEENEYRAIDDIIRLEEALTRIQEKKVKAIKTKYDLMGEDERRMRIEKMMKEIEIARERMDLEKAKVMGDPEDTTDDGFIDALSSKAGEAWDGFTEEG